MAVYRLNWKFGKVEYLTGGTFSDALNQAGFNVGALAALDYFEEVPELPDELKSFATVELDGEDPINNPHFTEALKNSGFAVGAQTDVTFGNHTSRYTYIGKSPTSFLYKAVSVA